MRSHKPEPSAPTSETSEPTPSTDAEPERRRPGPPRCLEPIGDTRDVERWELAAFLRTVVGLAPGEPGLGDWAAWYGRDAPAVVEAVDVEAWIGWCLAGLPLFSRRLPTIEHLRKEAMRVVAVIAMARTGGNITVVGRVLGISRQALRVNLRRLGLYPWPDAGITWAQRLRLAAIQTDGPHGRGAPR